MLDKKTIPKWSRGNSRNQRCDKVVEDLPQQVFQEKKWCLIRRKWKTLIHRSTHNIGQRTTKKIQLYVLYIWYKLPEQQNFLTFSSQLSKTSVVEVGIHILSNLDIKPSSPNFLTHQCFNFVLIQLKINRDVYLINKTVKLEDNWAKHASVIMNQTHKQIPNGSRTEDSLHSFNNINSFKKKIAL